MRASEMRTHVGDAFLQAAWAAAACADLGHAGVALGAAVLEHHHAVLVDVELGVVDAAVEVLDALEHHRAGAVRHELRVGRGRLDDGALGAQVAAQHGRCRHLS